MQAQVYRVRGVRQMDSLAADIAGRVRAGDTLLLTGELGSGKTTFVRALAGWLGVRDEVASPTFVIVSGYDVPAGGRVRRLLHLDLYRLSATQAAREPAVVETLAETGEVGTVIVVEWADRLPAVVRPRVHRLLFEYGQRDDERVVTIAW